MSTALSPSRYLRLFLLTTALVVGGTALLNYIADPFGLYHMGKPWDWIRTRPCLGSAMAMHKAYDVERAQADTLFLGDSRVFVGLDPHAPGVPQPAYNLALLGAKAYENLRYLQHASATHMPRTVVLGIDLRYFHPDTSTTGEFLEDRLRVRADGTPTPFRAFTDWAPTLLSVKALACSLRTLFAQTGPLVTYDSGYDPVREELDQHFDLASRVAIFNAAVTKPGPPPDYRDPQGRTPGLDAFRQIVIFCAAHQIRLIVFVLPSHALLLDASTQDWPTYGNWMASVLDIMEAEPGLQGEFWDFAGYNSISTEAFTPPSEHDSKTTHYWESSHFKKSVGDLVLQRLFTGQGPSAFGQRVTSATLQADLDRLKAEKEAWHNRGFAAPLESNPAPAQ